jgi:Flp pilus assembly CpaE family ATPase
MEPVTRVVLALDAPEVLDELLHFLDRSGVAQVLATVSDAQQVEAAARHLEPDLVLAEPRLAPFVPEGTPCIAIASRESVAALRAAIAAGVAAFTVWPVERDDLLARVRRFAVARRPLERRAIVVAVHAARGGAGCTFIATHLAQAIAHTDRSCVVLDVDPWGDDVASALGIPEGADGIHSLDELAGVVAELTPEQFDAATWAHPAGFRVVVAPRDDATVDQASLQRMVDVAAASVDVVIVHTPASLDAGTRWCVTTADVIVEVLALDVMSFRASTRLLARLAPDVEADRVRFVVNRAARSEVVPADVERVFGRAAAAVVPFDGSVPRLQDHGSLLSRRSRTARGIARWGEQLLRAPADARGAA